MMRWVILGAGVLAGVALATWLVKSHERPERKGGARRFGPETDRQRDLVEEASWESFPASDPPAF
jgi:hypothetical protein